jgi:micrococcal nuclease
VYEYQAALHRVVDGDTVDLQVDLGFGIVIQLRFRLAGINAPERNTKEGQLATANLSRLLTVVNTDMLRIRTFKNAHENADKQEKYGRYLCVIFSRALFGDAWYCVNQAMIENGDAVEYMPIRYAFDMPADLGA